MAEPFVSDRSSQETSSSLDYGIYYRWYHDASADHEERMLRNHRDQLGPLLPEKKSSVVLDIGCGMGFALLSLRVMGFENIHGIDIDESQIAFCARRGLPVERVVDTTAYLARYPEYFDVVLMLDVLEHIPLSDQLNVIRAVHRALRSEGRIILTVPNANHPLASRWRYNDYTHHTSFTERSLTFLLLNGGFTEVQILRQGLAKRPSAKLWRESARKEFRKWLIRFLWRQLLVTELEDIEDVDNIPLDLNITAFATTAK